MEKSALVTGGKSEAESGMEVGSAEKAEQLNESVGVLGMTGFSTIGESVDAGSIAEDAQADKVNAMAAITRKITSLIFI
jgi:hypothetical protein